MLHCSRYFGIEVVEEECPWHANAELAHVLSNGVQVITDGNIGAISVVGVVTSDGLQEYSRIRYRARDRPNVVQRQRKRDDTAQAYSSIRRLESDTPAEGGRFTDRSRRIGSDGAKAEFRGHSRCRSARRASGNMSRLPRVGDLTVVSHDRTTAVREFVQVVLSQKDCTGVFQPAHHLGIFRGYSIFEQLTGGRGADSRDVDQVFETDGNAVQRAAIF